MTLRTSVDDCHARPYGLCWHLRHYPFFAAAPVPFVVVVPPAGGVAAAFEGNVRPDLAPVVRRFAVDRVAEALGLRFPEDLRDPVLWAAVWELVLAGLRELTIAGPDAVAGPGPDAVTDHVELTGHWASDPVADRLRLSWAPDQLALRSRRFGEL
jgi:hypothetical protein